jgi:membrane peptidoglycan carboxypeptidase
MLLSGVVAWFTAMYFMAEFESRAAEFDLAELDHMEAASIIYDREGRELGKIFLQNRHPVALDMVAPMMVNAVIAAEDNNFATHGGVDYMGVLRAALANYRRGKISQGASTITQQLARNSFELRERTYRRKFLEMFLAQRIERNLTKDQIMELYLNRVYFGSGFYGVDAAARGYFGRSAKELDIGQCAMLAGLLKSPQALSPFNNKEAAKRTRDFVLKRMREQGLITQAQYGEQVEFPLYVMKRTNPFKVSYAVDFIRQQVIATLGYEQAMNGGVRIQTTLDRKIQREAKRAMQDTLAKVEGSKGYLHMTFEAYRVATEKLEAKVNRGDMTVRMPEPKYLQSAVLAIENSTGAILTLIGGREFKHSEYNRATMGRRPAGTAFVPFVYAAAYEQGIFPGTVVEDSCFDNRYVMVGGSAGILGEWGVERADNVYEGPMPTREALAKGKNAATVRLGLQAGIEALKKVSLQAGIKSPLREYSNSYLGSSEMALDELTLAYTVFPNGGNRPKQLYIIEKISDAKGTVMFAARPESVRAISPEAAYQVNLGLQDALRLGTGSAAFTELGLKEMPAGGKTGTAYDFTDTYFFGYNSSVTCGVWVGFDRPTTIYRGAFGKDLALPIWTKIMNAAVEDFPALKFAKPDTLKPVEICRITGMLATAHCAGTGIITEFGTEKEIPLVRCDVHGGGIRSYAREYDEEEWPRATAAVDLATIRPIAVMAPALLGFSDVYASVKPNGRKFDENIPVAKAIAVTPEETGDPVEENPDAASQGPGNGDTSSEADPTAPKVMADPEIRRAEAVQPLDSPLDAPAIQAATPEPIGF